GKKNIPGDLRFKVGKIDRYDRGVDHQGGGHRWLLLWAHSDIQYPQNSRAGAQEHQPNDGSLHTTKATFLTRTYVHVDDDDAARDARLTANASLPFQPRQRQIDRWN